MRFGESKRKRKERASAFFSPSLNELNLRERMRHWEDIVPRTRTNYTIRNVSFASSTSQQSSMSVDSDSDVLTKPIKRRTGAGKMEVSTNESGSESDSDSDTGSAFFRKEHPSSSYSFKIKGRSNPKPTAAPTSPSSSSCKAIRKSPIDFTSPDRPHPYVSLPANVAPQFNSSYNDDDDGSSSPDGVDAEDEILFRHFPFAPLDGDDAVADPDWSSSQEKCPDLAKSRLPRRTGIAGRVRQPQTARSKRSSHHHAASRAAKRSRVESEESETRGKSGERVEASDDWKNRRLKLWMRKVSIEYEPKARPFP